MTDWQKEIPEYIYKKYLKSCEEDNDNPTEDDFFFWMDEFGFHEIIEDFEEKVCPKDVALYLIEFLGDSYLMDIPRVGFERKFEIDGNKYVISVDILLPEDSVRNSVKYCLIYKEEPSTTQRSKG